MDRSQGKSCSKTLAHRFRVMATVCKKQKETATGHSPRSCVATTCQHLWPLWPSTVCPARREHGRLWGLPAWPALLKSFQGHISWDPQGGLWGASYLGKPRIKRIFRGFVDVISPHMEVHDKAGSFDSTNPPPFVSRAITHSFQSQTLAWSCRSC